MNLHESVLRLCVIAVAVVVPALERTCGAEDVRGDGCAVTNRAELLRGVDMSITNRVADYTADIRHKDKKTRENGISKLFTCALISTNLLHNRQVGRQIIEAYRQEPAVEVKMAMLATLDLMNDPDLPNLLKEAEKSDDPLVRNLVILVREKRYLKPVVLENPAMGKVSAGTDHMESPSSQGEGLPSGATPVTRTKEK